MIEVREYLVSVEGMAEYVALTTQAAELRKSLVPLRLFSLPDTGGLLNRPLHMYVYKDAVERDVKRRNLAANKDWIEYLKHVKPTMMEQRSNLFIEATSFLGEGVMTGMEAVHPERVDVKSNNGGNDNADPIYEYRRYQLQLGYDTVPKFMDNYAKGLDSKLATLDPSTELCTVMYNEVGSLNEVIEVWRHGAGSIGMQRSRENARQATEWRNTIKENAKLAITFTNSVHRPASFSPWQ